MLNEQLMAGLRRLIDEWDPIGAYDAATDTPPDEYDCLRAPVMGMLSRGVDTAAVAQFLERELREHFGLDPRPARPEEFAARLVRWFRTEASSSGQAD